MFVYIDRAEVGLSAFFVECFWLVSAVFALVDFALV
jgi:hypothetical protein